MKLIKDKFSGWELWFSDMTFAHPINDWAQVFGRWNWYSFHFLHIYFEKDCMLDGYEFEFVVLGLGFRVRINTWTEDNEVIKRVKSIEKKNAKRLKSKN